MRRLLWGLFGTVLLLLPGIATAQSTSTMAVSLDVLAGCAVRTNAIDFGIMTKGTTSATTGTITVNCSSGVPYLIELDQGLDYTSSYLYGDGRQMRVVNGAQWMDVPYGLYKSPGGAAWGGLSWGMGGPTGQTGTGTGADQAYTVYGSAGIPPNWVPFTTGTASDTVNVTVQF